MSKWTIELEGTEEECVAHLKTLLKSFELSAKVGEPLHHVFTSNKNSSLKCEQEKLTLDDCDGPEWDGRMND